nr:hypothetical protein [Leptospira ellisii]
MYRIKARWGCNGGATEDKRPKYIRKIECVLEFADTSGLKSTLSEILDEPATARLS